VLEAPLIGYTYAKVVVRITETGEEYKVCIDIGYS
jgi:hypothetical protein